MILGLFTELANTWTNWRTNWDELWNQRDKGVDSISQGFLKTAAAAYHGALAAVGIGSWAADQNNSGAMSAKDQFLQGLGQTARGVGDLFGAFGQLPVVRQIGDTASWATNEVVKRPLGTINLVVGDAFAGKGAGNLISASAWQQAYNDTRYVSFGQSYEYGAAARGFWLDKTLGLYDYTNPDDRAWLERQAPWLSKIPGFDRPVYGPQDVDPRTAIAHQRYLTNPIMRWTSGSLDAAADILADPTQYAGGIGRATKLRFWSGQMGAAATDKLLNNPNKWAKFSGSQGYNRTYDFIKKNAGTADGVEKIRQTIFNNHVAGGWMANALADVSDDPALYALTFRALYGDPKAWERLTQEAPRIADMTGRKYANYSISQVAKNYGLGDEFADRAAGNLTETETQAFLDSIANGHGMWGQLGNAVKGGGLLAKQTMPRLRLSSQWRVGVNQFFNYGPNTIFGDWVRPFGYTTGSITRTFLPSSRGGRHLDLNSLDSLRVFRNNLLQSRLERAQVDTFVNMYSRASSPEARFRVVNLAEDAAFKTHALAHGVKPETVEKILPDLSRYRAYNRAFVARNKRFLSSEALRAAEDSRAAGMAGNADRLEQLAGQLDEATKLGRFPQEHISALDMDGNLTLIPVDSPLDPSAPTLLSQTQDTHVLQDWGALDSALWWRGTALRDLERPKVGGVQAQSFGGQLGAVVWNTKEATTALAEAALSAWKIAAILRPGYLWRPLTDEAGGPLSVMGAWRSMGAATEGVKNSFWNNVNRLGLTHQIIHDAVIRDKAARLAGQGRKHLEGVVVDEAPSAGSDLVAHRTAPDLSGYVFGGHGYSTYDKALADGVISVDDFFGRLMEHGSHGNLPEVYQAIHDEFTNTHLPSTEETSRMFAAARDKARRAAIDHALASAGRNVYQSPSWQQSVIQSAINARMGKPQGVPGVGVAATPLGRPPTFDDQVASAASGQAALDAAPARKVGNDSTVPDMEEGSDVKWAGGTSPLSDLGHETLNDSLEEYKLTGFSSLNRGLRTGQLSTEDAARAEAIDHAMVHSRLTHSVVVHRDITDVAHVFGGAASGDLTGHTWTDPGFVSTSARPTEATSGTGQAALRIVVPQGTGAINLSPMAFNNGTPHEAELLLQRGLSFRVVRDHGNIGGIRRLDVVVDAPSVHPPGPPYERHESQPTPAQAQQALPISWDANTDELTSSVPVSDTAAAKAAFYHWFEEKDLAGTHTEPTINAALRGKIPMTPDVQKHINTLDELMAASKTDRPLFAYRGFSHAEGVLPPDWETASDLTGHSWDNLGFNSVTTDPDSAGMYGYGTFAVRFHLPEGSSGLTITGDSGQDFEVLLPRDLVTTVTKDWGVQGRTRWLDVEVQPKDHGLVVDPMSGASPNITTTSIDTHFSLTRPTRIPADVENFDEVYEYVHKHMDELLKPGSLLHAYVQPDGNLALHVARVRPESDLEAVKPGFGRRVGIPFSSVKGKPLRASGQTGFDVRTKDGQILHFRGAFEGQPGDLFAKQASSAGTVEAWVDAQSDTQKARLMAMAPTQWENVRPDDPGYSMSWERAAMQLGHDPAARRFIAGASIDDVVAWMHNTDSGRAYQYRLGPYLPQYYDRLHMVKGMVDTYLPTNPDRLAESEGLRRAVLQGNARYSHLEAVVAKDDMPEIHGATLAHATGNGYFPHLVRKWTGDIFRNISDMPNDKLLRLPFASERYQTHVRDLTRSREMWLKGDTFDQADLDAVEGLARDRALVDVRRYLFDSMATSDLAKGLRLLVPFGSALYDSAAKWGTVFRENPARAGMVWKVWSAPDKNGLIQDSDGNHLEVDDSGKERWWYLNPATGEKVYQPDDFVPQGKNVVFRLPSFMSPKVGGQQMNVVVNKQAFQTFLDIPTFGPLVAVPVNNFTLDHPEWASNRFVQTFVLPYGPSANGLNAAIPGNVRNWRDAWDNWVSGEESQQMTASSLQIYQAEMVNYAQGKRGNAPTFEEARSKASQIAALKFVSRLSGATAQFTTPYQPYVDFYHILEAKQRKPEDPTADEEFYNTVGEEYFWLTAKVTKNALGIPATLNSDQAYKKYADMMQKFPELATLIEGSEGAGVFNKAVYENQKRAKVRYGSQQHMRELLPLEQSVEDVQTRLGWIKYTKFADALHADMADRGITSLQQRGAEDLLANRDAFLEANMYWTDPYGARQVSPWFKDYSTTDQSLVEGRLAQMRQIVQDKRLQGRDDIRGLVEYLDARDQYKGYMDDLGVDSLSLKNKKTNGLASEWAAFVFNLKEKNLAFAQLYDRWLTHDDTLVAS